MKIRNNGECRIIFNGGCIHPGHIVDIKDEVLANVLVKNYPNQLICLDTAEVTVIEAAPVAEEDTKEAEVKAEKPKKAKAKKA